MDSRSLPASLVPAFFGGILLILIFQALFPDISVSLPSFPTHEEECIGEPILVDEPYEGDVIDPHSCLSQCEDGKPRYLLYTNGLATQCQNPPGCLDSGEDSGITCRPRP